MRSSPWGISNVIEADTLAARIILVTELKLRFMARTVIVRDSGLCSAPSRVDGCRELLLPVHFFPFSSLRLRLLLLSVIKEQIHRHTIRNPRTNTLTDSFN